MESFLNRDEDPDNDIKIKKKGYKRGASMIGQKVTKDLDPDDSPRPRSAIFNFSSAQ